MRIGRALRRCGQEARGAHAALGRLVSRRIVHGAVMRTVTSATRGQARIVGFSKRSGHGAEREEERKDDGQETPHLHRWYTRSESDGTRDGGGRNSDGANKGRGMRELGGAGKQEKERAREVRA